MFRRRLSQTIFSSSKKSSSSSKILGQFKSKKWNRITSFSTGRSTFWSRTPLLHSLKPGIDTNIFRQPSQRFHMLSINDDDDSDHDNGDEDDDMAEFDQELERAIKLLENHKESGIADGLAEELIAAFGGADMEQVIELLKMILSSSREFVQQRHGHNHGSDHEGGRDFAMTFLEPFEDGTLGKLLYHSILPFWEYLGDIFSDRIGLHYKRHLGSILKLKPTPENIKLIAIAETHWWQSRGRSGSIGKLMTAKQRERRLRAKLRQLAQSHPEKWTSIEKPGNK